ncbi:hypothetical protein JS756_12725 [Streptomyces actuosus]|uniref:Secreted protein n=1 Tax=Streptomyces actuosus TaxID=1885 RepID=A0ABS2VPD6_STRAS|nr:hypothetical protein [Streptomyces actuosus]MBN0044957.1 hypothetical protein [Streptomyces actuosus]
MQRRARAIRFSAVSALTVLALTGFSIGRGHGHGHGHGHAHGTGHGGGCSSSQQDHDGSSSSGGSNSTRHHDDEDDDHGSGDTSGETGAPRTGAVVTLVSCATRTQPYATVEVRNADDRDGTFTLTVSFVKADGDLLDVQQDEVDVPASTTVTVKEYVAGNAAAVDHCETDRQAPVA